MTARPGKMARTRISGGLGIGLDIGLDIGLGIGLGFALGNGFCGRCIENRHGFMLNDY